MTTNPFQHLYDACNAGNSKQKLVNLPEFPRLIDVEMTNTCNFRCLMCPTGNFSQKRAKGFMTDELFYRLLEDIRPYRTPLRFIRWGEPLTHPSILQYLRDCRTAGVMTHINTNGSKLTDEMMDELLAIPVESIKFSFQGVDRKSYAEMRNIDFFDELIETVRRLHDKRGDRRYPFIHVSTTITYESKEMVTHFRETFKGIADMVNVGRTVLEYVDLNAVRLRPHEFEELKRLKELESVVKVHPECPEVFDKLSINWDGTITACCMDSENKMLLGDLTKNTVKEVWDSQLLNHYRSMLADMRHDELSLCKSCYDTHGLSIPGLQDT